MLGVVRSEHLFLSQKSIVVLLGLWIESCIMVRIPALGASGRAHDSFIDASDAASAIGVGPCIVAFFRIGIAVADESHATRVFGRQNGIQREEPHAARSLV